MNYHIRRFIPAFKGLWFAVRHDAGFKLEFYIGAIVISTALYILHPFTSTEFLFVIFGWCLILITELQNSALEITLDHLHPDHHEAVGRSKDMAAAAVLLATLFLGFVLVYLGYIRWLH